MVAIPESESIPAQGVSPAQAAALVAYILFISLWGYAELLERNKRYRFGFVIGPGSLQAHTVQQLVREEYARLHDEDETQPSSLPVSEPVAASKQAEEFSYTNNAFVRCLSLSPQALLESRLTLRAAVEFGTILLWYYVADRTTVFPQGIKSYSRDVLAFLFLVLTLVAFCTSQRQARVATLLNRQQTEEWKGWMQVLFLLYHYYEAKEVYNAIRVFIAGYVWMTGYGNFMYYYKTSNFSFGRFCQMMWRLNFLVTMVCLVLHNSYMLYYICPMHTIFTVMVYGALGLGHQYNKYTWGVAVKILGSMLVVFVCWDIKPVFYTIWSPFVWLMGYSDPRRPTTDKLYEWHFRSSLDRYVWIHGMLCAYLHPYGEAALQRIDKMEKTTRVAIRAGIAAVAMAVLITWYNYVYILPKIQYNAIHPYTSWIPISVWIVLRNLTPMLRTKSLGLYGWLGCITLETYVGQFHTWLATGIPDGQPKMLLAFFPPQYPLLNFAGTTAVYVFVSYRLFLLTNDLKDVVVPASAGRQMLRNFTLVGVSATALYLAGTFLVQVTGWSDLPSPTGVLLQT